MDWPDLSVCSPQTAQRLAASLVCAALQLLPAAAQGATPRIPGETPWAASLQYEPTSHEETAMQHAGYRWRGPAASQPDWQGVSRDTSYFLGYQFAVIGVLYVAPESISGWDREQKRNYSFDKWRHNVSRPVRDEDRWWINYILHPYWGGTYYIRARERGLDRMQSFLYSALLSSLFEYGAEALAEPVSAQDLIVTPVAGALVGEYLFAPLQQRIRAKQGTLDWSDKALLFAIDPLGVVSAETDRLLGVKTTLRIQRIGMPRPAAVKARPGPEPASPRSAAPVWGVQLHIDW